MVAIGLVAPAVALSQGTGAADSDRDFLDELLGDTDAPREPSARDERDAADLAEPIPVDADPEAGSDPTARRSRSRFIEEIVVTAQKREESLQDVPISIQAFSGDMIDAQGIVDQTDLPRITPGLQISDQVGFTTIFLRGIGSDAFLTADPSVVTYIDGIYFPFASGLAQDFGAVERIEVLKGPQGTLFGRNATGGAISILSKSPQMETTEISVESSFARFNDLRSRLRVNLPLGETLAASVALLHKKSDHFVDATAAGEPLPSDRTKAGRARLRWVPTDWADITLSALQYNLDGHSSVFTPHTEVTPLGRLLGVEAQHPRRAEVDTPVFNNIDNTVFYGEANLFSEAFDVKLLGSYQDIVLDAWFDFDGSNQPLLSFRPPNNFSVTRTAELQILSNDQTWGDRRLQWIIGGYAFSSTSGFDPTIGVIGNINTDLLIPGLGLPPGLEQAVVDLAGLLNPLTQGGLATTYLEGVLDARSISAFAEATLSLTEWLDVTLGGRFQSEERRIRKSTVGLSLPILGQDPVQGERIQLIEWQYAQDTDGNPVGLSDTVDSFNPKVSLNLRPGVGDLLVYLTAQRATKSSTFNAVAVLERPTLVDPERITAYEIGAKGSVFNGLTQYNAAAFWYDIDDLQVQHFALLNGGIVSFENVPAARTRGLEVGLTTVLLPNTFDDLVLSVAATYLDAKYTEWPDASGFAEPSFLFRRGLDFTGNNIVRAPTFTGTTSLSKSWHLPGGTLEVAGDIYYNSGFFLEATNSSRSEQRAYKDISARASFLVDRWNIRLTGFVQNLTDELYVQGGLPNDFGNALLFAPPRVYGVRLGWDFER